MWIFIIPLGIKNPFFTDEIAGYIDITDTFVSVSGDYERYFEQDGIRYHHIIDPKTGYPVKNDIRSVAVISKNGVIADALSTALFVMGKEKALEFYKKNIYDFEAIIFSTNGCVTITEKLLETMA